MDCRDFDRPLSFHVRYYDDRLRYKLHNVIPYKTSSPNHLVYKVMRSSDKVNIWLTNDGIVAQLDVDGYRNYDHFPTHAPVTQIVCSMLSKRGRLIVVDIDSIQPGLF